MITNTYKILKKDSTTRYQNKFNELVKECLKKIYITEIPSNSFGKNSQNFVEKIRDKIIPDSFTLMSLNVVSVFTNIPLSFLKKFIRNSWLVIRQFTAQKFINKFNINV